MLHVSVASCNLLMGVHSASAADAALRAIINQVTLFSLGDICGENTVINI